jgi:hypothetical protein
MCECHVHGWQVGMESVGNPHFHVLTSKEIYKHLTIISKCGYDNLTF